MPKPILQDLHFVFLCQMQLKFKHKLVRDLAWVLQSANLLDDSLATDTSPFIEAFSIEAHLKELDQNPKPLTAFLAARNTHRLGHYFEALVFYGLDYAANYRRVASNIPVRTQKGISIGEADLVVFNKSTSEYEHWELAVKFFLAHTSAAETTYIGPNANDYLHLKLKKLKEHQCKIFDCPEGKLVLNDLSIPWVTSKLYVKGILFYHPNQPYKIPPYLHQKHLSSWWIYAKEASQFFKQENRFALLHKKQWLSTPEAPIETLDKYSFLELLDATFLESPRSLYVSVYKGGVLQSQGFVVHNAWPVI